MTSRTTPRRTIVGLTLFALVVAGCGSSSGKAAETVKANPPTSTSTPTPTGPVLLAEFASGVGGVTTGASQPIWLEPGAVAALDGTSVFSVRADGAEGDRLFRLDPHTGAVMSSWPLTTPGLSVAAVAPKARWIALTDRKPGYGSQSRTATELVVFDTAPGHEIHRLHLTGDVQPEAFAIDGTRVFALNYLVDHYRVQTIDLASGKRFDTSDRNKFIPPEDMHGQAVHGVMSKDRTLLATLYRNPDDADEPAFVHVLDLEYGWSYCADLSAPFGTGAPGTDTIELTSRGTVVVAATQANQLAEIPINDVHTPTTEPIHVTYRAGTIASADAAFRSVPGFEYLIAEPR